MYYKRIKDLREDADLKQKDIADILGISQRVYSYYETGQRNTPIDILYKLAEYYNTTVDYLVNKTNKR